MTSQGVDDAFNADYNPANAQGNGIGLSLVKRITDRFGWTIAVESERSKGTRIKLFFPATEILGIQA